MESRWQKSAAVCAALAMIAGACGWQLLLVTKVDQPRKGAAVSIVSQLNFRYDSAFIWSILVSADGLQALSGFILDEGEGEKPLSKVGDSMAATAGSDKGRVIATMVQNRELRVLFEPENAAYVVHKRFLVATAGNGCVVQYWSQYTDFESEVDERAAGERKKITECADAFRTVVESRIKPSQRSPHGH